MPITTWTLEDGDGTEVNVSNGKEVKFVEGGGIDINWTDTDNGTDGDPYDLTFTVNAAQTNVTSLGTLTALTVDGVLSLKNGATSAGKIEFYEDSDNGTNKVTLIGPASTSDITLTLPSSDGDSGQALTTDGNGVMSWTTIGGAYTAWAVKTTNYTASSKDQLICNHASTPFTITLPTASVSGGNQGDTVIIANAGAALVTIGRNSSNINSAAADGTLPQGNSVQLVYVDDTIGWFEV